MAAQYRDVSNETVDHPLAARLVISNPPPLCVAPCSSDAVGANASTCSQYNSIPFARSHCHVGPSQHGKMDKSATHNSNARVRNKIG